jgi:predicted O-methyltransferase YrrM
MTEIGRHVSKAEALSRSFAVEQTMLIGRSGNLPPNVTQLEFLYDLALLAPDGVACEVGVLYGGSLLCWAAARQGRGELIAVDNWTLRPHLRELFLANMDRYGLQVCVLDVNGWEAPAVIEEEIAFCFIDSDHTYWGIGKEIPAWTERIMPGGIIAFHDYGVWKPNVAVKALVDVWYDMTEWQQDGQWKEMGLVGSTIAFRRPNG